VLIRPFLGEYRDLGVRARRAEQILGSGRAFLAVTGLIAIYIDPTEPARFAGLTYLLLSGYALYSVALLVLVHRAAGISTAFSRAIHGIDIVSASALSFFSEGPVSPFFLFFLFALLSAAYRWGLRETISTATTIVAIFLIEMAAAAYGPWKQTVFASIDFDVVQVSLRIAYVMLTGLLLGYLADGEKQFRSEIAAINDVMREPRIDLGFSESVARITALLRRIFRATAVDLVIRDTETGRTFLWDARASGSDVDAVQTNRLKLDQQTSDAWFFQTGSRCWCSRLRRRPTELSLVTLDEHGTGLRSGSITLSSALTEARQFHAMAGVDLELPGEWRGRILWFDSREITPRLIHLQFLSTFADHVTPILSNLFLLRRLRSRASAAERARVARELHDSSIQALIGIEMKAEALRRSAVDLAPTVSAELDDIQRLLREEVLGLRELMQELRPVDLDAPHQLPSVLAGVVERFRRDTGIAARFASDGNASRLTLRTAIELVRITQEALINVRKHSRARAVFVRLACYEQDWTLTIEDDGEGFDFSGTFTGAELSNRLAGPAMILERVRLIGGQVSIDSRPGAGARIEVSFYESRRVH
jgi:signal transduction histidine kinase